jgi:hypothetical protein
VIARRLGALPALALVAFAAFPHHRSVTALDLAAHGAIRVDNSRAGAAILSAPGLQPGGTAYGAVTLVNRGAETTPLQLQSSPPSGRLSDTLDVRVEDSERGIVADGTLAELAGCHDLGSLPAGRSRTYRFTVRLKRAAGNGYAGSRASVDERWVAGSGCGGGAASASAGRVALSHRTVALVRGRARVGIRCRGPRGAACSGRVTLVARSWRSRRLFVADAHAGRFNVRAGGATTVLVAVPPESLSTLRGRRKAVAVAVLRGSFGTKRRLVTLIRPGRR